MTATNSTRTVGIDSSNIKIGTGTTLNASANSTTPATDSLASGDASAIANTTAQAAILNTTIRVGTTANLSAVESGIVAANATTTTGNASATASNDGPTGAIINSSQAPNLIAVGTDAKLTASANNSASAIAGTVGGFASALANSGKVFGLKNVGLSAGGGTSLDADAKATNWATASSVGLPGQGDGSSATAGGSAAKVVGIYGSGASLPTAQPAGDGAGSSGADGPTGPLKIAFGNSTASLTANGTASFNANAAAVTGSAGAQSLARLVAGIAVGSSHVPTAPAGSSDNGGQGRTGGMAISFGENGNVIGKGVVDSANATATTVTGPASAQVGITTIGGIVDLNKLGGIAGSAAVADSPLPAGASSLTIGRDGDVQALALGRSKASAFSVTSPSDLDVRATSDNDRVVGIAIDKLAIGANANQLYGGASSDQTATAQSTTSGGDPVAMAAVGDFVAGFHGTTVRVGEDATDPLAEAVLVANATASGVTASKGSNAVAGDGSEVVGFHQGSFSVGENILASKLFKASGSSGLLANAVATNGASSSQAGGSTTRVIGLDSAPVSIGKGGGVEASGLGSVAASSTTTNGDASALAQQLGRGIRDSQIKIGNGGDVSGSAQLFGAASATTTSGSSTATTQLDAKGIDNDVRIGIGEAGGVKGEATASDLGTSALAVSGDAAAGSALRAIGIDLGDGTPIRIGTNGTTSGSGIATAPKVMATSTTTTTSGNAAFKVDQGAMGIMGSGAMGPSAPTSSSGGSSIGSGLGGDIRGTGQGSASGQASTITGDALGSTHAWIAGIKNVDLKATNVIASATGIYDSKALAVTGDATASSDVGVAGLIGHDNVAKLSGNLTASAVLSNTVLATTTTGAASAMAHGNAVGIQGYDINVLSSGIINASAISTTNVTATSVSLV